MKVPGCVLDISDASYAALRLWDLLEVPEITENRG